MTESAKPRWPTLTAFALLAMGILLLSLPMWSGQFLAAPWSDQYATGYAFRAWAAEQWRALGHIPLWNPEIFGGLPFVGAMHGDIFYPTAWTRLVLPTALAMNLGFVVHYLLAGWFMYLLLRMLKASWAGSVTGAFAYQLAGVVGSYVAPGHDGKLFVTALFPLALIALILGIRQRRLEGYALLALAVGLGVLSPHPQMLYYMLVAAGIFALYLALGEKGPIDRRRALGTLGLALAAVVLGFGVGMIQVLPFYQYLPFSPRADTYRGFQDATSYAVAWSHVPEMFLSGFVGTSQAGTYWGGNLIKLHSEYLGLPVVALATLGVTAPGRRRLVLWLGAIGALMLLVALGAGTPFYRLWYEVMPFMKKVRAPGMALYLVAFVLAVYAAFGVERLERGAGKRASVVWMLIGGVVVLAAAAGAFGGLARFLAQGLETGGGRAVAAAGAAVGAIRVGVAVSGFALLLTGLAAWLRQRQKLPALAFAFAVPLVVGADLWRNAEPFWEWSRAHEELFGGDALIERVRSTPEPYRVLQFPAEVYPGSALMAYDVPQLLGHHGNELHRFDELMGGKNEWRYLHNLVLWDLYAVNQVLVPARLPIRDQLPGFGERFDSVFSASSAGMGGAADVYVRRSPAPYARVVPAALALPDEQAIAVIANPRSGFQPDRVLLVAPDAPVEPERLSVLPEPLAVAARFDAWEPGRMRITLEPAAPQDAYLLVAENWYREWEATVDGAPATLLRGNVAMLAVALPVGARDVELTYRGVAYSRGKAVSLASLFVVLLGFAVPGVRRGMRRE